MLKRLKKSFLIFQVLLVLFLLFSFNLNAKNSFLVAPTSAEIDLKKPTTLSFIVTNNGDDNIRLNISPIYFEIGSKFMPPLKALDPKTSKEDSLVPFMKVSPKVISLKPTEQRTVRVSVRPNKELKKKLGEYRAHVLFAMLDIAETLGKKKEAGEKGIGVQLSFKSETAIVIYGSSGKGEAEIVPECSITKNGKLKLKIKNKGLWRFDGWLRIYDPKDKDKKLVEDRVFMTRQSIKEELLNWKPEEGTKSVEINWVPLDEKRKSFKTTCNIS
jgi:P pilus assembly chaperone PapD